MTTHDNILKDLIKLANTLDEAGFDKEANVVDQLTKVAVKRAIEAKERFWKKVDKGDGCWTWKGAKSGGYGIFRISGKNYLAHRLSWLWAGKKIPKGMVLRHKCNNPTCVCPAHLQLGTQQHNVDDRVISDRSAKGERNGKARLTQKSLPIIKRLRELNWTVKAIADLFGVGRSTITNILLGHTWGWTDK